MKRFARVRAIGDICVPDNRDELYATNSTARRRFLGRREKPMDELEGLAVELGYVNEKGAPLIGHLPIHERYEALPFVDVEMTDAIAKLCGVGRYTKRQPEIELLAQCEAMTVAHATKLLDAKAKTEGAAPAPALVKRSKKDGGDA